MNDAASLRQVTLLRPLHDITCAVLLLLLLLLYLGGGWPQADDHASRHHLLSQVRSNRKCRRTPGALLTAEKREEIRAEEREGACM